MPGICLILSASISLSAAGTTSAEELLHAAPKALLAGSDTCALAGEMPVNEKPTAVVGSLVLIEFYQDVISPVLGARCPMHPSCSEYSRLCLQRHGLLKGIALSADRLLRCGSDRTFYGPVLVGPMQARLDDPPPEE